MERTQVFKLQAGDIINMFTPFSMKKPFSWLSFLIRKASKSTWSHSAVVIDIWGRTFICEALATGIVVRPIEEWGEGAIVSVSRPKEPVDKKEFSYRAMAQVGHKGYDFSGLLWYQLLYQITGRWYGHTTASSHTTDRFYCSEYAAWLYSSCFPKWYETTPQMCHDNTCHFDHVYEGIDTTLY
jgi:hypothetical protein